MNAATAAGPRGLPHSAAQGRFATVAWDRLSQVLGGPVVPYLPTAEEPQVTTELQLQPGDSLFAEGSGAAYAYLVKSGVLQCMGRNDNGLGVPGSISYASEGDLIGLYEQQARRPEGVSAVTHATLLALSLDDLNHAQASSPMLAELVARRSSVAMKRNWHMAYQLRDQPPLARTISGLAYLLRIANPPSQGRPMDANLAPVALSLEGLSRWLGLPPAAVSQQLEQLAQHQLLSFRGGHVTSLSHELMKVTPRTLGIGPQ
jgi:CRP-like cAMP-binding protein